jgi:hypothetical protein
MSLAVGLVEGQIEEQPSQRTNILNCQRNKLRKMQIKGRVLSSGGTRGWLWVAAATPEKLEITRIPLIFL